MYFVNIPQKITKALNLSVTVLFKSTQACQNSIDIKGMAGNILAPKKITTTDTSYLAVFTCR